MEENQITDFLLPGHIWKHRKRGAESIVMFVTNLHLPEKYHEVYPPQVVYIDVNGNITSSTIEQFTKTRAFDSVEPEVEQAIYAMQERLSGESEELPEEEITEEENTEETTIEGAIGPIVEPISSPGLDISFNVSTEAARPVIEASSLQKQAEAFGATPETNGTLYALSFILGADLTKEDLFIAFDSEIVRYNSFKVNGIDVKWDTFLGIYPTIRNGQLYGVAYFRENFATVEEPSHAAETPTPVEAQKPTEVAPETPKVGNIVLPETTA